MIQLAFDFSFKSSELACRYLGVLAFSYLKEHFVFSSSIVYQDEMIMQLFLCRAFFLVKACSPIVAG